MKFEELFKIKVMNNICEILQTSENVMFLIQTEYSLGNDRQGMFIGI